MNGPIKSQGSPLQHQVKSLQGWLSGQDIKTKGKELSEGGADNSQECLSDRMSKQTQQTSQKDGAS